MDKNNNLEAINLLEEDKYTFSVLRSILTKKCEFILTDNEQYIICYSYKPFPIWVWTRDDVTKEQAEKVYTILKEKSLLNGQYRFNLKYDFANFLMERARIDGIEISISLELLAYECLVPIKPTKIAKRLLINAKYDLPYPNAKPMIVCDFLDDKQKLIEFLTNI